MNSNCMNKTICIFLLAIIVAITCIAFISCNWNDQDYYYRAVTLDDVIVQQDSSQLLSLSFIIRPQETIEDLYIRISFFDSNQNPITAPTKEIGDVNKGSEYTITLTLPDDISLSQRMSISKYKVEFFRGRIKVDQNKKGVCFQHKFDDGVITKNATCSDMGEKTLSCVNCNYKKTYRVAMEDHSYVLLSIIVEPTCIFSGSGKYICTQCAMSEQRPVDPLGHVDNNSDGKCDTCGRTIAA